MKLSDFILLNVEEKTNTVLHQGILIGKRNQAHCLVFLFRLNHYYVETYCNRGDKSIEEFRVFDNTLLLNPYLQSISLEQLLRGGTKN